jgi:hypothetical protein
MDEFMTIPFSGSLSALNEDSGASLECGRRHEVKMQMPISGGNLPTAGHFSYADSRELRRERRLRGEAA